MNIETFFLAAWWGSGEWSPESQKGLSSILSPAGALCMFSLCLCGCFEMLPQTENIFRLRGYKFSTGVNVRTNSSTLICSGVLSLYEQGTLNKFLHRWHGGSWNHCPCLFIFVYCIYLYLCFYLYVTLCDQSGSHTVNNSAWNSYKKSKRSQKKKQKHCGFH